MHRFFLAAIALAGAAFASPATAQDLPLDAITRAFVEGVSLCAKAKKADIGLAALPPEEFALLGAADRSARDLVRAPRGRPAWTVEGGGDIVILVEPTDRACTVFAYGPRVAPVFAETAAVLMAPEFGFREEPVEQTPSAIQRDLLLDASHGVVLARLVGGEPGMLGRRFRYPLLVAYVQVLEDEAP